MNKNKTIESDPEILSRVTSLNVLATKLVEGLLSGHHRSRHTGSSVEFADYKDYTPGDEIKIDKMKLKIPNRNSKSESPPTNSGIPSSRAEPIH